LFGTLAAGGMVMMQEENFMQYRKVAWVTDKFGVTWQPVLE
jgi:predicted 3-demethylubiquinone-9 3-methyltransferase (glyoxalase superfamily)